MSEINTGGPAFPVLIDRRHDPDFDYEVGMTLRQYAAIHLKVPDSGTDWLDDMIRKSQRDDFAAKAMQSAVARGGLHGFYPTDAKMAYDVAAAMLRAREAA